MIALHIVLLYFLIAISMFCPGVLLTRRKQDWTIGEQVIGILAISILCVYGISFTLYVFRIEYTGILELLIYGVLLLLSLRPISTFVRIRQVKRILLLIVILNVWLLLLSMLVVSFSGGDWTFDWLQHFRKVRFFYYFVDPSVLPDLVDRPPLMNLLAVFFCNIFGCKFYVYQIVFVFLSSLSVLPVLEISSAFSNKRRVAMFPLLFLLMMSPSFVQNCTFTWTKLLTVFFILSSLLFYFRGWQEERSDKFVFSWILMSGAMLTHYSAVPYALLMGLHYVGYVLWSRKNRFRELAFCFFSSLALFMTWILWALRNYGFRGTFMRNPPVMDTMKLSFADNVMKVLKNFYHTFVPHFLTLDINKEIVQESKIGYIRDYAFLLYQTNLYFVFGAIGLPLIVFFLFRSWKSVKHRKKRSAPCFFIVYMIVFSFLLGIIVHGSLSNYGLMHICSQPLILLGISYLAANFHLLKPFVVKLAVVLCFLCDALFGIFVHFHVQSFRAEVVSLAIKPRYNFLLKNRAKVCFLADYFSDYRTIIWLLLACLTCYLTWSLLSGRDFPFANPDPE